MTILNQMKEDVAFLIGFIPTLKKEEQQHWIDRLRTLRLEIDLGIIPDEYNPISTKPPIDFSEHAQNSHTFFAIKEPRDHHYRTNSHFTVLSDEGNPVLNFFMEHKKNKRYPKGAFSLKVKKGFTKEDKKEPEYAVKVYNPEKFLGSIDELRTAMRAAFCYKKLGRAGVAFRNKGRQEEKQYIVTKWLDGVNLSEANPEQIQSMPIPQRIAMAISLMHQLDALHRLGIIFYDMKPGNVMCNKNLDTLFLVDLDSARPKHEAPFKDEMPITTVRYLSPQLKLALKREQGENWHLLFDEQTDIYALGLTLICLFGEIYKLEKASSPHLSPFSKTYIISNGKEYQSHPTLRKLLWKMTHAEPDEPMTVQHLIDEFKAVLLQYPDHEPYLDPDPLVDFTAHYTPQEGKRAFDEIEYELRQYEQRQNSFKLQLKIKEVVEETAEEIKEERVKSIPKEDPPESGCTWCSMM